MVNSRTQSANHKPERLPKNTLAKTGALHHMQQCRTRYLLARLTQHVDMAFNGQKVRGNLDPYFILEIEHILPNNPENDLRSTWQEKHPELVYDEHKNRLSNLNLLEKPINIVAGNDIYAGKVPEYAKSRNQKNIQRGNQANFNPAKFR